MPAYSFRRWYRRRYGRYSRFYRRYRRYRRRYRKFVNGSSRSRVRVKIPVTINASFTVPATSTLSNVLSITPFYNNTTRSGAAVNCLLGGFVQSPLFEAYANLYDEMKLDGFKLNFSITTPIGPAPGVFPNLSVYTSVDRKLISNDFAEAYDNLTGQGYPTAANMRTSSTFLSSVALNNSITKMQRSCYASDLFEKNSFIDSDYYTSAGTRINGVNGQHLTQPRQTPTAFNPAMYFAIDTGSSVDADNDRVCNVVIEIMHYVTFRNPKYGGGGASAKISGVARSILPDIDSDGDMDDGDGDMDVPRPPAAATAAAAADDDDDASGPIRRGRRAVVVQNRHNNKTMGKNA